MRFLQSQVALTSSPGGVSHAINFRGLLDRVIARLGLC